jgi:hypothetical protein
MEHRAPVSGSAKWSLFFRRWPNFYSRCIDRDGGSAKGERLHLLVAIILAMAFTATSIQTQK